MDIYNLFDGELDVERDHPGFSWRAARVGRRIGGEMIGGTVYKLEPGQSSFPYHYEHGNEEWLLVVDGTPMLRAPSGERELRPGDVVCFPVGHDGAHLVRNNSDRPARVLFVSTMRRPSATVYPDSDKIGVKVDEDRAVLFRRGSAVDYWDGETPDGGGQRPSGL